MQIPELLNETRSQQILGKIDSNLEKLVVFWLQHISPNLITLTISIGVSGFMGCALLLWAAESLLTRLFSQPLSTVEFETLQWIHQFANSLLDSLMLSVTQLCNPEVAVSVGLLTLGILMAQQAWLETWICAIADLGSILLDKGFKLLVARIRPDLYPPLIQEPTFSFPSGHALGATVLYGMIAYLLAVRYPQWAIGIYLLTIILIGVVGFSRLYLGVHWPTDVLAGWGSGFLWLMICIVMLRLQRLEKKVGGNG
jgi:membrane-associated phospholipid phosphatase